MSFPNTSLGQRVRAPLQALLALSDLACEGIDNGGSFRFADHLYKGEPSGRYVIGCWLDAAFMRMRAASAFRRRYLHARDAIQHVVRTRASGGMIRILTVPCGIPRDAVEAANALAREFPALVDGIEYVGMDIDPHALRVAKEFASASALRSIRFHQGNALLRGDYPTGHFDFASSTGLTEFLEDRDVEALFANVYDVLGPGGTFYTSASAPDRISGGLLGAIKLRARYRSQSEIAALVGALPWQSATYAVDPTGLQTFVTAVK